MNFLMTLSVAIVYERLYGYGGTERVLAEFLTLYPAAQIYTLIHNPKTLADTPLEGVKVKTSFMQIIPGAEQLYSGLVPLMPLAIESLDLEKFDLVISLSHSVSHGAITGRHQRHVSYISTPMRYAWHLRDEYLRLHHLDGPIFRGAANLALDLVRRWDVMASRRSDALIANSSWTQEHVRQAWGRSADVIYPPVDVTRFEPASQREGFYLHVSRLVPYKMTAEIVCAFNRLNLPLIIVGGGPQFPALQKLARENVKLLGQQPDQVVADLMNRAKAFVYMATEDFGIVMAEAQAAGCPVIAYRKGGAAEIVLDEETGLLFNEQNRESLSDAVIRSSSMNFDAAIASNNAQRFSSQRFRDEVSAFMNKTRRV